MVFLPLQSTNVATARLFPYLCPEGQINAVATDPFSFPDNRVTPTIVVLLLMVEDCLSPGWSRSTVLNSKITENGLWSF